MNRMLSLLLAVLFAAVSMADDADIYINQPGAPPYAVLALDYRPNIFSSTCSDTGHPVTDTAKAISCLDTLGEDYTVDAVSGNVDISNAPIYQFITSLEPDGTPSAAGVGLGKSDTAIDPWDQILAVYAVALQWIPKKINIALAISHNDTCTGAGNTAGTGIGNCSNGGYILKGFTNVDPADVSNTGADDLIDKLLALPNANTGSVTHLFQGAELYYEISRYLRGDPIWNAHLGWDSYVSNSKGTDAYNLDNVLNRAADDRCTADGTLAATCSGTIDAGVGAEPDPSIINTTNYSSISSGVYDSIYNDPYAANGHTGECTKTYVINNFFKESQQEADSNDEIEADGDLGVSSVGSDPFLDLVTAFADEPFANGLPVQSIFIAGPQAINAGKVPDYSEAGTPDSELEIGPFSRDNARQLLDGLIAGFTAILSKSATFVAASVPVNVFDRVEVIDNVYLALFMADQDAKPFWPGNVKKLKIVEDPNDADESIIVATNNQTESAFADDGRIKHSAITYWTKANGFDLQDDIGEIDILEEAGKDGRSVHRGGAGQQIPGFIDSSGDPGFPGTHNDNADSVSNADGDPSPRQMFTEPTATNTDSDADGLIALDASSALSSDTDIQAALGAASASEAVEFLAWFRGVDAEDNNGDGALDNFSGAAASRDSLSARRWMMGDALHSQPLPVNYGCSTIAVDCEQRIRLFYGTNDGVFHMTRNTTNSGDESGAEIAAVVPHSVLGLAKILSGGPTTPLHPYGIDGRPVSLIIDNDNDGHIESADNDKVYIYITMRRGGDEIFAFDASDPDSPPKLLWKINSGTTGFSELGMTFSNPLIGQVQPEVLSGGTIVKKDALIFGGGMCGGWSGSLRVCKDKAQVDHRGPDTSGNAVYVVDALTGALIWKATGTSGSTDTIPNISGSDHFESSIMTHSIPSDITAYDSNGNEVLDRGYVGDTGGNIWRIELPEAQPDGTNAVDGREKWYVGRFAKLGIDAVTSGVAADEAANDRRFYHAPDVVQTFMPDGVTPVDKVIITSGDRPHPRAENVTNGVFVLNDFNIGINPPLLLDGVDGGQPNGTGTPVDTPIVKGDLSDTVNCVADQTDTACVTAASDPQGWHLEYTQPGEKGLSNPLIVADTIFATSYLPNGEPGAGGAADVCAAPEGSSRLYALNLSNGAATDLDEDGVIDDKYTPIGDGLLGDVQPLGSKDILIPGTGVDGKQIKGVTSRTQFKIYWYEKGLDIP